GRDRLAGEPAPPGSRQARARPGAAPASDHRHGHGLAPRVAIVASGSELVRGDRHDRNGPFLASSLLRLGFEPARITVVGDDPAELASEPRKRLHADLLVASVAT